MASQSSGAVRCRVPVGGGACGTDKKGWVGGHVDVDTASGTLTAPGMTVDGTDGATDDTLLLGLFADLAKGREDALEGIWDRCADLLYGFALWRTGSPPDAEDVVQEVWVRLARSGRLLGRVRNPRAYLMRMTRNAAADLMAGRRTVPIEENTPIPVVVEPADARVDGRRASELVLRLSPKLREVVFLHQLADLSFREIGEICRIPMFTAASRHRLAIRKLRELMGVEHDRQA